MTNWNALVWEHGPLVFGTAWRILGHASDTEDVVQEVFLQAYQVLRARGVRNWPGLLRRLAACRALDRLRQRKATVPLDGLDLVSSGSAPDAAAMGRELAERLREAIAQLPDGEATVFCLRYFEDLSYQQIADTLKIRPGAVGVALHKARAKLDALLTEAVRGE